ncbi:MAG: hypothetical protein IID45_08390, partial [Planctomycetes bacterium]|nr:hypothetical protein [Planctomycetota bacterium]
DRVVLSGGQDGFAKLWRIAGYDEVRMIRGQFLAGNEDAVLGLAIDRRGRMIATAGKDRIARVHEIGKNLLVDHRIRTYGEGHDFLATNVRYVRSGQSDERRFFTAGMDNTVRLWDSVTGAELARLAETGRHATLALSPKGRWLATGFSRNDASTIDSGANAGRVVALIWHADHLENVENPIPAELVVIPERLKDRDGHKRAPPSVTALSFSADGRTLLVCDDTGGAFLWAVDQQPQILRRLGMKANGINHTKRINACTFFPDGQRAATASSDNTILIWNVKTGEAIDSLVFPDSVSAVEVSSDGGLLLGVSRTRADALLRVWRVKASIQRNDFSEVTLPDRFVTSARFFPNENRVLLVARKSSRQGGTAGSSRSDSSKAVDQPSTRRTVADRKKLRDEVVLYQWDTRASAAKPLWTVKAIGQSVWSAACSPDGRRILTVGGRTARLLERDDGRQLMVFGPHLSVTSVSFSRDSDLLATTEDGNSVKLWSVQNRRLLQRLIGIHSGAISTAEFSPVDNHRLMTAGTRTVKFWQLDKGTGRWNQIEPTLNVAGIVNNPASKTTSRGASAPGSRPTIRDAAYSPDGLRVATAFDDKTVGIWDTRTGKLLSRLAGRYGHRDQITCVRFSPDGRWLMTGSRDRTAIIWERSASGWTAIAKLTGHPAPVNSVSISHDRQRVLTGSDDKTAKLWDTSLLVHGGVIRPGAERSLLKQRIRDDLEKTLNSLDRVEQLEGDHKWKRDILAVAKDLANLPPLNAEKNVQLAIPKTIKELRLLIAAISKIVNDDVSSSFRRPDMSEPMKAAAAL